MAQYTYSMLLSHNLFCVLLKFYKGSIHHYHCVHKVNLAGYVLFVSTTNIIITITTTLMVIIITLLICLMSFCS